MADDIDPNFEARFNKRIREMEIGKKLDFTLDGVKKLNDRMDKMEKEALSHIKYPCDKCHEKTLESGDSHCRNCGNVVDYWDEIPEWKNYHNRS